MAIAGETMTPRAGTIASDTRADEEFIPVLDVGPFLLGEPGALDRLAGEVRFALENIGFFYIVNHGVPDILVDRILSATQAFHELTEEEKQAIRVNRDQSGYVPMKASMNTTSGINRNTAPNVVELFLAHRDRAPDESAVIEGRRFQGLNQWPARTPMPGFREIVNAYHDTMLALGRRLLPLYAVALGMPAGHFYRYFRDPQSIVRMARYPVPASVEDNQFGAAPHGDLGFLTMLPEARVPGLEIKMPSGRWMPEPIVPGAFLVNAGETLRRMSNHRFLATPHRVAVSSDADRYQVAFFFNPDYDAIIEVLPSCTDADHPPRDEPQRFEDLAVHYIESTYSAIHKAPQAAE
ncbi:MAG: 2-oxoglutarate and iron-dependent oxygenase domain-containing protein [Alphaproteobacteria bacterium]|jgi:isopenicillin N synthase-like dioxygenase